MGTGDCEEVGVESWGFYGEVVVKMFSLFGVEGWELETIVELELETIVELKPLLILQVKPVVLQCWNLCLKPVELKPLLS